MCVKGLNLTTSRRVLQVILIFDYEEGGGAQ